MNSADIGHSWLGYFGLTEMEAETAFRAASTLLDGQGTREAFEELASGAPHVSGLSRAQLHRVCFPLLSEVGYATVVNRGGDMDPALETFEGYIRELLAKPEFVRDLSVWTLFFAVREASDKFRLADCRSTQSEAHLDGVLLGRIAAACEKWSNIVEEPLARYNSSTVLQKIDLSMLWGEQATGGDVGLVIDLDGRAIQPSDDHPHKPRGRRIVPIILQSKRYVRPNADIGQHHHLRGYQRHTLSRNDCASAYLFYENGPNLIEKPLPPIVKPVAMVADQNTTPAIEDGLDLAAYLIGAIFDQARFPSAATPAEALRMIYANGRPGHLAVIAGDRKTAAYYSNEFFNLATEIRQRGTDERPWIQT